MYKCENVQMGAFVCTIQQMQQKKVTNRTFTH